MDAQLALTDAPLEPVEAVWLLDVFVPGRPAAQGSKHARPIYRGRGEARTFTGNVAMTDSAGAGLVDWRGDVRQAALLCWEGRPPLDGPVEVDCTFVMPRPLSTPKRRTPPAIRKPDGDKLERAVWDALTHVVWVDDARVVDWHGRKRLAELGETPGCRIRVREAR